ncbi:hypothetical protein [Paenibacillus humicola]|uniref:hypothetical protein n=1 Tax=Paenibacillus humicola TaxID=3110540 RepID=UPI00237BCD5F|nr:hypothetical protein [Paenibacillus humicola]
MPHRRRGRRPLRLWTAALALLIAVWLVWRGGMTLAAAGGGSGAMHTVEQFYRDEQSGDFGSAWELFHPLMQQKFEKASYIQKRAHIMMQDFGVKTFDFKAGRPKHLSAWRISSDEPEINDVYEIVVTQHFHTPYGDFELVQPCYLAKDDGAWKLLWSYEGTG